MKLTERKAWTMSAFIELRGLSLITMKICSSFSRLMKLPNHDFLASLKGRRQNEITTGFKTLAWFVHASCFIWTKLAKEGQKLETLLSFLFLDDEDNHNQKYFIDLREKLDSNEKVWHSCSLSLLRCVALLTLEKSPELDWTCPPGWELWMLKFAELHQWDLTS